MSFRKKVALARMMATRVVLVSFTTTENLKNMINIKKCILFQKVSYIPVVLYVV